MGRRRKWITHKLNTTVERFVLWATPRRRLADIYEIIEDPPPAYALEMLVCTVRAIQKDVIEPVLFPGINIDCECPTPPERRQGFAGVTKALRRSFVLFLFLYVWYAAVVEEPLRQFVDIPPGSTLLLDLLLIALPLQRRSLSPVLSREPVEFDSFTDANYRKALLRDRDKLPMGEFSPSKSPMRAGAIALMILLVLFAAAWPVIRWMADGSLPPGVHAESTIGLAIVSLVVVAWFLVFFKASRIAAKAFDEEIERLPI
jgi:hypothetical protein